MIYSSDESRQGDLGLTAERWRENKHSSIIQNVAGCTVDDLDDDVDTEMITIRCLSS